MQIDFTPKELGGLYREGKRKKNWMVQIPGEGVAPMSEFRQRNEEMEHHFTV